MAKKSFKENAQQSLGGLNAIIRNTTREERAAVPEGESEKPESEPESEAPGKERGAALEPRPRSQPKAKAKAKPRERSASEAGCKEGETRKTFIVQKEVAEKLLDIAYWEPGKLKDHVNAALEAYTQKHWTKKRPKGS